MLKKITGILLSAILGMSLLTGCALFGYDNERDYKQVVATIASVTITDESSEENRLHPFVTEEKKIYKYELVSVLNQSGPTLIQNYGYTPEQAVEYLLDQLVTRTLILNEADAQIYFGNIVWGQNEENSVLQSVYTVIDSELASLRNTILEEHGEETSGVEDSQYATDETEASTTYPKQETEEVGPYDGLPHAELVALVVERTKGDLTDDPSKENDDYDEYFAKIDERSDYKLRSMLDTLDLQDVEPWEPDKLRYPGLYGTEEVRSLETEAMRRLVASLKENITEDYRIEEADRKAYLAEIAELEKIGSEKGVPYIYPELGKQKFIAYLIGDGYRENVKINLLEQHITDSVDVTDEEIQAEYDSMLAEQKTKYADIDSFRSDVSASGSDPILYYPNGDYYYVKHILVPFSDEQSAQLSAYTSGEGALLGSEAIRRFKENLGKNVKGYEHRDGEDYGLPKTIDDIYADISSTMAAVRGDLKAADRAFESLIYKYNTDTGIFGNETGYPVRAVFDSDTDEYDSTYMEEFSRAADELYRAGVEGAISKPVTTDYGVHILYLARIVPSVGMTVGLNDYLSYGEHTKIRDKIAEDRRNEKTNQMFSVWQNTKIGYYLTVRKVVTRNEDAYKSLYEA